MKRMKTLLTAAAVLPVLVACGDTGNQTSTADLNNLAMADQGRTAAPANPLMDSHMRMQSAMAAAVGANASETWVRKMIEHHRGAIEMSEILVAQGGDPNVVEKARMTVQEQRRDQQELERMLQAGISGGSGSANPFQEAEARMNERMMAASGATPSETWVRMMIEHHRGGAEIANILVRQGGDPEVVAMARRMAEMQTRDIAELERLLTGEHQASDVAKAEAADQNAAPPPAQPKSAQTPPQRPAPRPERPASRPKAPEPADPHAGHDMGNMANMQH